MCWGASAAPGTVAHCARAKGRRRGGGRANIEAKRCRNLRFSPRPSPPLQAHYRATKPAKTAAQLANQKAAFLASVPEANRGAISDELLSTAADLGMVENVALLSNAPDNGFTGVNLYCDDEGQALGLPRNVRACEIAACAGKPLDVCGDAFLARVMDSEDAFARVDLLLSEVSSSAPWVKAAADQNRRKAASESAHVKLARAGVKAGVNDLTATKIEELPTAPASTKTPSSAKPPPCPHRDAGNAAFKAGRFDDAVACYTRAADAAPSSSSPAWLAAVNNRAAARLAAGDHAGAAQDAGAVLAIAPDDVKARLRRAAAREGVGEAAGAREDYEAVLKVEPGNAQARAGVARVGEGSG